MIALTTVQRGIVQLQAVMRGVLARRARPKRVRLSDKPATVIATTESNPALQPHTITSSEVLHSDEVQSVPATEDAEQHVHMASDITTPTATNVDRVITSDAHSNASYWHELGLEIRECWWNARSRDARAVQTSPRSLSVLGCEVEGELMLHDTQRDDAPSDTSVVPFVLWWDASHAQLNSRFEHLFRSRRPRNSSTNNLSSDVSDVRLRFHVQTDFVQTSGAGARQGHAVLRVGDILARADDVSTAGTGPHDRREEVAYCTKDIDVPIAWQDDPSKRLPEACPLRISYRVVSRASVVSRPFEPMLSSASRLSLRDDALEIQDEALHALERAESTGGKLEIEELHPRSSDEAVEFYPPITLAAFGIEEVQLSPLSESASSGSGTPLSTVEDSEPPVSDGMPVSQPEKSALQDFPLEANGMELENGERVSGAATDDAALGIEEIQFSSLSESASSASEASMPMVEDSTQAVSDVTPASQSETPIIQEISAGASEEVLEEGGYPSEAASTHASESVSSRELLIQTGAYGGAVDAAVTSNSDAEDGDAESVHTADTSVAALDASEVVPSTRDQSSQVDADAFVIDIEATGGSDVCAGEEQLRSTEGPPDDTSSEAEAEIATHYLSPLSASDASDASDSEALVMSGQDDEGATVRATQDVAVQTDSIRIVSTVTLSEIVPSTVDAACGTTDNDDEAADHIALSDELSDAQEDEVKHNEELKSSIEQITEAHATDREGSDSQIQVEAQEDERQQVGILESSSAAVDDDLSSSSVPTKEAEDSASNINLDVTTAQQKEPCPSLSADKLELICQLLMEIRDACGAERVREILAAHTAHVARHSSSVGRSGDVAIGFTTHQEDSDDSEEDPMEQEVSHSVDEGRMQQLQSQPQHQQLSVTVSPTSDTREAPVRSERVSTSISNHTVKLTPHHSPVAASTTLQRPRARNLKPPSWSDSQTLQHEMRLRVAQSGGDAERLSGCDRGSCEADTAASSNAEATALVSSRYADKLFTNTIDASAFVFRTRPAQKRLPYRADSETERIARIMQGSVKYWRKGDEHTLTSDDDSVDSDSDDDFFF